VDISGQLKVQKDLFNTCQTFVSTSSEQNVFALNTLAKDLNTTIINLEKAFELQQAKDRKTVEHIISAISQIKEQVTLLC
jgi:molecular chaperone GrpE (heat shock protein)